MGNSSLELLKQIVLNLIRRNRLRITFVTIRQCLCCPLAILPTQPMRIRIRIFFLNLTFWQSLRSKVLLRHFGTCNIYRSIICGITEQYEDLFSQLAQVRQSRQVQRLIWRAFSKSCSNLQLVSFVNQLGSIIKYNMDLYLDGVQLFQHKIYLIRFEEAGKGH